MPGVTPGRPGLLRSVVLAAESMLDDLVPLVVANLAFGAVLVVVIVAAQLSLLGNLLAIPLSLPAAGVMRMAAWRVRRGSVRLAAFADGARNVRLVLGLATVQLTASFLLALDVVIAWSMGSLLGGMLAMLALYALVVLWMLAVVAWPIVLDPERDAEPVRRRLLVAVALVLSRPLRVAGLALIVAVLLATATVAIVIILVFGFSLACLVAAHYALPAADQLAQRSPPA